MKKATKIFLWSTCIILFVCIDYPPYNDWREVCGFGMTDYPEFDYKKKTISCTYPEGELTWDGRTI